MIALPPRADDPAARAVVDSPVGPLLLRAVDGALTHLGFTPDEGPDAAPPDDPLLAAAASQLEEYFAGVRTDFDLPLAPQGTPFQQRVWTALCDIPYAQTESYGSLAARIGAPGSARAVGAANGQNPVSIVVPCHRVVGANGSLTGYGGGLDRKRTLLSLEAGVRPRQPATAGLW